MRLRLKGVRAGGKALRTAAETAHSGHFPRSFHPLTTIKGYVSGILDGVADTPEKREHYLRTIYDRACGMDKMVDSLFLFSKLDLNQEPFRMGGSTSCPISKIGAARRGKRPTAWRSCFGAALAKRAGHSRPFPVRPGSGQPARQQHQIPPGDSGK